MIYTNAQFRSILNGLGYREELSSDPEYPISYDNSPLTDDITGQAVVVLQEDFNIQVDGIVGPQTMDTATDEMETIHAELNQVMGSNIPEGEPFYGPLTVAAVQDFDRAYEPSRTGFLSTFISRLSTSLRIQPAITTDAVCEQPQPKVHQFIQDKNGFWLTIHPYTGQTIYADSQAELCQLIAETRKPRYRPSPWF